MHFCFDYTIYINKILNSSKKYKLFLNIYIKLEAFNFYNLFSVGK